MSRIRLELHRLDDRLAPAILPAGFSITPFVTGLTDPTAIHELPDGRLLIAEQGGTLKLSSSAGGTASGILSLSVDSTGERGLLGITSDPDFSTNGFIYLFHTVPGDGTAPAHNRVSRFALFGNTIDPSTGTPIVDLEPLSTTRTNHNGGALHFGPDGTLYVAVGENAQPDLSQSPTSRFGKILRYNPDGSIPADNPSTIAGLNGPTQGEFRAIYAAGLRNPFTFDVDPVTGRIFVNDVGAAEFEEVNELAPGRNFGWPATEGDFDQAAFPNFSRPLVSYPHGSGTSSGFAVTGGAFYRPTIATFPSQFLGDFFYADFINDWIRLYNVQSGTDTLFASELEAGGVVDLDSSRDGSLLVTSRSAGTISRIQFSATGDPRVAISNNGTVSVQSTLSGSELRRIVPRNDNVSLSAALRVATGDFNGDGVSDTAVGSGPNAVSNTVAIYNGADGTLLSIFMPFETSFTGGVFVAAGDVDGDGRADLAVSPDEGGGPRVTVYRNGEPGRVLANFFGIDDPDFRGGARVALGDITGDGQADLVVSAGFQGGPRIAGYDGRSVTDGAPAPIFADFFAFEESLRNGTFVAVGDFDSDGRGDVVAGAGPNGSPRVIVFSGSDLVSSNEKRMLANFFAGDPNDRSGVRVATTDVDRDDVADLVIGMAMTTAPNRAIFYRGTSILGSDSPSIFRESPQSSSDPGGVFVG